MAEVRQQKGSLASQIWGWVVIAGAVLFGFLAYWLVFSVGTSSDGYSCGTFLSPNDFGSRARYGDAGCGYRFREGWAMVLVLLTLAAILLAIGVGLVVRARTKRPTANGSSD